MKSRRRKSPVLLGDSSLRPPRPLRRIGFRACRRRGSYLRGIPTHGGPVMSSPVCRWGILGAANIARKNWKGIRLAGNATLTAVASRDPAKAAAFIDDCQADAPFPTAPAACTYEELLRRPDVDAVYIPLPTGVRP